jgi:three-Cys-motif partner protein
MAAKHSILRRYLEAWFPKLAWTKRVVFIDGFAGPGEYSDGEPGSPIIALQAAIEHRGNLSGCVLEYIFVERDHDRYEHLRGLLQNLSKPENIKLQPVHGEFADELEGLLDQLEAEGKNLAPSFFMVDPFGFSGVPFALIARAAKQPRSEFLISFMYESIVRWRNHPDHEETFDNLFGCSEWREADAFDDPNERKHFLLDLYTSQLEKAGLKYTRTFEMLDEGNRTEYFLVFASHSIEGLKAMKDAMWKVDPEGGVQFSDATVSSQLTLISPEPNYFQLKQQIIGNFAGQQVTIEDVERFVVVDTAFRETHFRRQILIPMEKSRELEIVASPRKKAFTYPPGTLIKFV